MDSFRFLSQAGTRISAKKGDHIYRQGEDDRHVYVITDGLVKAYYLSIDGKEKVKSLLLPGAFIGSMTACYGKQKCSFSLVCLEDTKLIAMSFDDLRNMSTKNIQVAQYVIDGLLELAMKKERREYDFLCLSAEDRYRRMLEHEPSLLGRVTQNDIARYLGITPVALSRIKSRLSAISKD